MFCSRCGLRVEEGSRYCQACGQEAGVSGTLPPTAASVAPVSTPLPYAGFWIRFAAYMIDGVILGIPFFFVAIGLIFRFRRFRSIAGGPLVTRDAAFVGPMFLGFFFTLTLFVVAQWLYFAAMESSARQATFGKAAMSLRVADLKGQPLTFGHATGRFFAKIVSGMIPLAIGYIMAGFTEKKQALHDMIAGTLVLRNS